MAIYLGDNLLTSSGGGGASVVSANTVPIANGDGDDYVNSSITRTLASGAGTLNLGSHAPGSIEIGSSIVVNGVTITTTAADTFSSVAVTASGAVTVPAANYDFIDESTAVTSINGGFSLPSISPEGDSGFFLHIDSSGNITAVEPATGGGGGSQTVQATYLQVSGGGGGGNGSTNQGNGGGGAGGYERGTVELTTGDTITVVIGAGAAAQSSTSGVRGGQTSFQVDTTSVGTAPLGGGWGGAAGTVLPGSGASGGGGIGAGTAGQTGGAAGTAGQGNAGGSGAVSGGGGGGGGAGAAGGAGDSGSGGSGGIGNTMTDLISTDNATDAGIGQVSGADVYYSGGGGGSRISIARSPNGLGTGANSGGGGQAHRAGDSGFVLLRVPDDLSIVGQAGVALTTYDEPGFHVYGITESGTYEVQNS